MSKIIIEHFKKNDPILHAIIQHIDHDQAFTLNKSEDYFISLCESIISQQLSIKASDTIFKRFLALFPEQKITPEYLLTLEDAKIRNVGTSWAKIKYLKDLAQKVKDREIHLEKLSESDDATVITELTKVKGIGIWTAEMFLMFSLGREDIFSFGDLGLRNAIKKLYKLKKDVTQAEALEISSKWSPYRTYACRILWQSLK